MLKIMFICHGNICRSPMAEYVFRNMINEKNYGDKIQVASSATSTEEIGNPVHSGTAKQLAKVGISTKEKRAVQLTKKDYAEYDFLVGMDSANIRNIYRITGANSEAGDSKISRLLDFTENPRDIADPWYSGNFSLTYDDVLEGSIAFIKFLEENNYIS